MSRLIWIYTVCTGICNGLLGCKDSASLFSVCSSRHSMMTGIYPFKAGLQNGVILPNRAECSPLENEFFPKKLQKLGYATHMVGK